MECSFFWIFGSYEPCRPRSAVNISSQWPQRPTRAPARPAGEKWGGGEGRFLEGGVGMWWGGWWLVDGDFSGEGRGTGDGGERWR